jgi:hypothetical protein
MMFSPRRVTTRHAAELRTIGALTALWRAKLSALRERQARVEPEQRHPAVVEVLRQLAEQRRCDQAAQAG